jgi:hypothetical protein
MGNTLLGQTGSRAAAEFFRCEKRIENGAWVFLCGARLQNKVSASRHHSGLSRQ